MTRIIELEGVTLLHIFIYQCILFILDVTLLTV